MRRRARQGPQSKAWSISVRSPQWLFPLRWCKVASRRDGGGGAAEEEAYEWVLETVGLSPNCRKIGRVTPEISDFEAPLEWCRKHSQRGGLRIFGLHSERRCGMTRRTDHREETTTRGLEGWASARYSAGYGFCSEAPCGKSVFVLGLNLGMCAALRNWLGFAHWIIREDTSWNWWSQEQWGSQRFRNCLDPVVFCAVPAFDFLSSWRRFCASSTGGAWIRRLVDAWPLIGYQLRWSSQQILANPVERLVFKSVSV